MEFLNRQLPLLGRIISEDGPVSAWIVACGGLFVSVATCGAAIVVFVGLYVIYCLYVWKAPGAVPWEKYEQEPSYEEKLKQVKIGEPPIINVALKIAYKFVRLTKNIQSEMARASDDAEDHRTIAIRYEEHTEQECWAVGIILPEESEQILENLQQKGYIAWTLPRVGSAIFLSFPDLTEKSKFYPNHESHRLINDVNRKWELDAKPFVTIHGKNELHFFKPFDQSVVLRDIIVPEAWQHIQATSRRGNTVSPIRE